MTVKELRDKLDNYDDDYDVFIADDALYVHDGVNSAEWIMDGEGNGFEDEDEE